jgi:hypothetical protein
MAAEQRLPPVLLAAPLLLWPAAWNAYPIVFADTGTYLSQAVQHYLGWDRPVFYSLFLLPLHATLTLWPVVVAQALITADVLRLVLRVLLPAFSAWWLLPLTAFLAVGSWLPWMVSQVMPDVFTPLLVLLLCVLVFAPEALTRRERICRVVLAAFMIACQQSSLVLSAVLLCCLIPSRLWLRPERVRTVLWRRLPLVAAPPVLAAVALLTVNLAGHGRLSLSPYGNMFVLARVIYDGPGMAVLRRDCPSAGWRLCPYLDRFPPRLDDFLWRADSPVILAGGHKAVSAEADPIIAAALRAYPFSELRAALGNAWEQLGRFASGDGLQPWPRQVSPWIERDFPAVEQAAYAAARQQRGLLSVPAWLAALHRIVSLAGVAACVALLPHALRRRHATAGFLLAALLTLPASAAITGILSAPHDRYQSRVMWLPACIAIIACAAACTITRTSQARNPE